MTVTRHQTPAGICPELPRPIADWAPMNPLPQKAGLLASQLQSCYLYITHIAGGQIWWRYDRDEERTLHAVAMHSCWITETLAMAVKMDSTHATFFRIRSNTTFGTEQEPLFFQGAASWAVRLVFVG